MNITGAVLERLDAPAPYATSRPLTVSELQLDEPGPGQILVRIEAAGVCHSDLSVVAGTRPRPVPMLLGHEAAGTVARLGDGVLDLSVGQRIVLTFLPRCGRCAGCRTQGALPCERGAAANAAGVLLDGSRRLARGGAPVAHHLGVSAFASYAVLDRRSVVPVPDDVPPDVAALLGCAVLTGGGAVLNVARPGPGESLMVVGLGGVGLAALLVARAAGVERLIAVDTLPAKLARARALGADEALTPAEVAARGTRCAHVLECAGHAAAFELAVAATAPGGRTVTVGLPPPDARASISPLALTGEARSIVGCYLGSALPERDIPRYVEWWRAGRLPLEELISDRIRLQDLNDAMDALAAGSAVRQIIDLA